MLTRLKNLSVLALILLLTACSSAVRLTPTHQVVIDTLTPAPTAILTATPGQPVISPTLAVTSIVLRGHTGGVAQLAWSPDGSLLASAAGGGTDLGIRLWSPDGQLVRTLKGHKAPVLSLTWSPDGKLLASGSADQTVRLWSPDGKLVRTIMVDQGSVWAVAWSPDGTLLATGSIVSFLNPTVQLWSPTGSLVMSMKTKYSGGKFYNLAWSPDGQRLLGGATDYAVWTRDGTQVGYLAGCEHCTPSWGAAWSPDSSTFAIGDESGHLQLYDREGHPLASRQSDFDINAIAWSPDGDIARSGSGRMD